MTTSIEAIVHSKVPCHRPDPLALRNLAGHPIRLNWDQKQVLAQLCNGLQTKQIAFVLDIRYDDAKKLRASLLHLTGCKTPAQLAVWACKSNLV